MTTIEQLQIEFASKNPEGFTAEDLPLQVFSAIRLSSVPGKYQGLQSPVRLPWTLEELRSSQWRWVLNGALCDWDPGRIAPGGLIRHHVRVDCLSPEQQHDWSQFRVAQLEALLEEVGESDSQTLEEIRAEILQELQRFPPVLGTGDWVELWRQPNGDLLAEIRRSYGQVRSVSNSGVDVHFVSPELCSEPRLPAWRLRRLPPVEPLPFDWDPIGQNLPEDGEQVWCVCPANPHYGEPVTVDYCSIWGAFSADEFFYFEELGRRIESPPEPPSPAAASTSLPKATRDFSPAPARNPASGWIERRIGNRQRPTPYVSYYYGYKQDGKQEKHYIPVARLSRVQELLKQRRPASEILDFLRSSS